MFNLHDFTFENLVNGYRNGFFSKEQVSIYAINYMTKGLFTESDIEKINDILNEEHTEETSDEEMSEDIVDKSEELSV